MQIAATVVLSPQDLKAWETVFLLAEDFNLAIREAKVRLDITMIIQ